jgi:hypothetical protein
MRSPWPFLAVSRSADAGGVAPATDPARLQEVPIMNQRNLVPGLLLIGLGIYLGIVQLTGAGAEAIVAVIGVAFVVSYALTRNYGFLVPGAIMTGLGLGILWETEVSSGGGAVVIGLGVGFLAIYVVDAIVRRSAALWWPLIPGGILATIGALIETDRTRLMEYTSLVWPLALIAVGITLVIVQARTRQEGTDTTTDGSTTKGP